MKIHEQGIRGKVFEDIEIKNSNLPALPKNAFDLKVAETVRFSKNKIKELGTRSVKIIPMNNVSNGGK